MRLTLRIPPTSNHAFKNVTRKTKDGKTFTGQQLTDEALAWLTSTALLARVRARVARWPRRPTQRKVVVELEVWWPDNRTRDMSNLHKLTADALEGIVYPDDRWALMRDMDWHVDKTNPRLELTIWPLENPTERDH